MKSLSTSSSNLSNDLRVTLRLLGAHQGINAATATVAAAVLSMQGGLQGIDGTAITQGLADTTLPGRFQVCFVVGGLFGYNYHITRPCPLHRCCACHTKVGKASHHGWCWMVLIHKNHPLPWSIRTIKHLAARHNHHLEWCLRWQTTRTMHHACRYTMGVNTALVYASRHTYNTHKQELRALHPSVAVFTTTEIAGGAVRATPPGHLLAAWQTARSPTGVQRRCRELIMASVLASLQRAVMEVAALAGPGQAPVVVVCGSLHAVRDALKITELF